MSYQKTLILDFKVQRILTHYSESLKDMSQFWKLLHQKCAQTILPREKVNTFQIKKVNK